MPVSEAFLYAIFCMLVVFVVLVALWGIIRLFSLVIGLIEGRKQSRQ
ncbi:OadG family transporter subunit [Anaerocolumna xylanovorans]|nr:OadG family transporter subunit [Anaerocolumna xylanovorans]